jgi:hypothetical protein
MLRFFRNRLATATPADEQSLAADDRFVSLRDSILCTLRQNEPQLQELDRIDRRPVWQLQEWAEILSPQLPRAISASDMQKQRTVNALAHWLHRTTLDESKITTLRQLGW